MNRVLLLLVVLYILLLPSMETTAQTTDPNCDLVVVDDADLFKRQMPAVQAAADQLISLGPDVRVRTITSFSPATSLEQYEKDLVAECPSWQDSDDSRNDNFIIFMISLNDRKIGLYYGGNWASQLDVSSDSIRDKTMVPFLSQKDYAGGFIAGINGVAEDITPATSVKPTVATTQPKTSTPEKPTDYTWLWWTLGILLALVVLALGLLGWSAWQKNAQERQTARLSALSTREAASELVRKLEDTFKELELKIKLLIGAVDKETSDALTSRLQGLNKKHSGLAIGLGNQTTLTASLDQTNLSVQSYQKIETGLQKIVDTGSELVGLADELSSRIQAVEELLELLPKQLSTAEQQVGSLKTKLGPLANQGFGVSSLEKRLSNTTETLENAKSALVEHALIKTQDLVVRLTADIDELSQTVDAIPDLKNRCDNCQPVFEQIGSFLDVHQSEFETKSYRDRLSQLIVAAEKANKELVKDQPDFISLTNTINQIVLEAGELQKNSQDRLARARTEVREAEEKRAAAQEALDRATEYMERHPSRVKDSTRTKFDEAQAQLQAAQGATNLNALAFAIIALELAQSSQSAARSDTYVPSHSGGSSSDYSSGGSSSGFSSSHDSGSSSSFGGFDGGSSSSFGGGDGGSSSSF